MSSASQTKIFGMNVSVDPKVIVLLLVILAALIYYFTSSSDSPGSSSSASPASTLPNIGRPAGGVNPSLVGRAAAARRAAARAAKNVNDTLKLVAVDGSRGDVDPTLRLGLLERVRAVPEASGLRNLFDTTAAAAQNLPPLPAHPPKMTPGPLTTGPDQTAASTPPPPPPFSIPLKYYGFVKPTGHAVNESRGFFMDGDNILVGGEGDVLEKRFLIVALTPNSARLEDTQAKQGQDLQVTPEATPSQ